MKLIDQTIFEQLKAGGDLPSPKGSALAIIRLTQREDVSLNELAHAIKPDPVFSGRLIKAANGVKMIGGRPVVSILEALTVLGVAPVRTLALGFSLLTANRGGKCKNFDYQRFWSHSLVRAISMQALTTLTQAAPPEDAFSVGLLFRIGELALATLYPAEYSNIVKQAGESPDGRLLDLERSTLVLTHNTLSASMMLDWGLPASYVEPVYFFEALEDVPFEAGTRPYTMTHLLSLSDHIADICLAPPAKRQALMPKLFLLGSRLALDAENLKLVYDKVAHEWHEWGAMLSVPSSPMPAFNDLAGPPPAAAQAGTPAIEAGAAGFRMRVLAVVGDAARRGSLRDMLNQAGHEVFEAAGAQQGFEMAMELQPQVMLIDWAMPEMDGIKLTGLLRETKIGRACYILILSEVDDEDRLIAAFENGVDDFMLMPVRPRMLAARLRSANRLIQLQLEVERDREEIRHFAAEQAVTNRRLHEVAMSDVLTGFPNRRYAIERMQQEWAVGTRSQQPLSVMVIDIDRFKHFNDTYGHDIGDMVLTNVANSLKKSLRAKDVACRMGGDEFLIISPDTSLEAAVAVAERVRRMVNAATVQAGGRALQISISIGVAARDAAMADIDALIKRADQGVYAAKQRSRNCVAALQLSEKV